VEVEGEAVGRSRALSGEAETKGWDNLPKDPQFSVQATGFNNRVTDAERIVFENLNKLIKEKGLEAGTVNIVVSKMPCVSCQSVATQFAKANPGFKVNFYYPLPILMG
jgi:hypothetical protein